MVAAQRVIGRNFDEDDADTVRILDPHLSQSPRLGYWLTQDVNAGGCQPRVLGLDIPYLEPDHQRVPGSADGAAGDLQKTCAKKEDHARIGR